MELLAGEADYDVTLKGVLREREGRGREKGEADYDVTLKGVLRARDE